MASQRIRYVSREPVSPGAVLAGVLEERSIQKQEFAIRCGRTPKLISEILSGAAPIVPETALQFERVLDVSASFWMNLEAQYRLMLKRQSEEQDWVDHKEWIRKYPLKEIADRIGFTVSKDAIENIRQLLKFYGVASINACDELFRSKVLGVQYRRASDFTDEKIHELTWLRLGRLAAEKINCAPYDARKFKAVLPTFRALTSLPMEEFIETLVSRCAECGVAVVLIPELKKTHTSGATHWLSKDKAIIQLSNRGKWNDTFWFNFYHEAGHVFLHSKKKTYVDFDTTKNSEGEEAEAARIEDEANDFAANMLVPENLYRKYFRVYPEKPRYSQANIETYAKEIGISSGILLGQFQKRGILRWNSVLNKRLKIRLEIPEVAPN